jgi:hypothetical protein
VLGVEVCFGSPNAVVDVNGRDVVAERPQDVPKTRRVGTAGDEACDRTTRLEERMVADELLDAERERCLHAPSVTDRSVVPAPWPVGA